MNVGPTELPMILLSLGVLGALSFAYVWAGLTTWAWSARWPRPIHLPFRVFVTAVGFLYAPVWVPVWALMRWVRGPQPQIR